MAVAINNKVRLNFCDFLMQFILISVESLLGFLVGGFGWWEVGMGDDGMVLEFSFSGSPVRKRQLEQETRNDQRASLS